MQDLSIIRQVITPFIVKYGSNNCKIKNMKTMDGSNYNSENFKMLEKIYKQEIIPDSIHRLNKVISKYKDEKLSEFYFKLLSYYTKYTELNSKQKQVYYEKYIEPFIAKMEGYINTNLDVDIKTINIINQIKLEFTLDSDYLLNYYTLKPTIKLEAETEIDNAKEKNATKAKVTIYITKGDKTNAVETAELELNIAKSINIEVIVTQADNAYNSAMVLLTLSNFLKSNEIENILRENPNAASIRVAIQGNAIIAYAVYDVYGNVIKRYDAKKFTLKKLLMAGAIALIVLIFMQTFLIAAFVLTKIIIGIFLFVLSLLTMLNKTLQSILLTKVSPAASKIPRLGRKESYLNLEMNNEEFQGKIKDLTDRINKLLELTTIKLQKSSKMFMENESVNTTTNTDNNNAQITNTDNSAANTETPNANAMALAFLILAAGTSMLIFKAMGMPILIQALIYSIGILYIAISSKIGAEGLFSAFKYILTNFNDAVNTVIADPTFGVAVVKTTIIGIFSFVIYVIVQKFVNKKAPVGSAPSADRILTEIQTKFK
jgi:hypothetical protein